MVDDKNYLIFEVWGNPHAYKSVEYYVERSNTTPIREKCKSTLKALLKSYENSSCILFFPSTMGEVRKNYDEIIKSAEERAKSFLKEEDYCGIDYMKRVKVKVLPGIGRFKEDGKHKILVGRINQIRTSAFMIALEELKDANPDTVILDISHGVNYMPVYIREALFDAVIAYIAVSQNKKIRWIVYNSEPVQEENVEANIQLVEYLEKIDEKQALSILYGKLNTIIKKYGNSNFTPVNWVQNKFGNANFYRKVHFSDDWDKLYKLVKRFVKSVNRGLVLLLPYIKPDLSCINVGKLKDELLRFSYIKYDSGVVHVDEDKSLVVYLLEPKIETCFILTAAELINNMEVDEVSGKYDIEQLNKISEKYIVEEAARKIVENELKQIEECTKIASLLNIKLNSEEPYNVYYYISQQKCREKRLIDIYRKKEIESIESEVCKGQLKISEEQLNEWRKTWTPDERNFYAHAGLERNITLITKTKEKIWLRYTEAGLEQAFKYAEKES